MSKGGTYGRGERSGIVRQQKTKRRRRTIRRLKKKIK